MRTFDPAAWAAIVGITLAAGCGGGGGGSGGGSGGLASVALTDAPSDRLEAFEVDVAGVELLHEGGGTVTVLAAAARVDLTELVDVAELVGAQTVPAGSYTGVVLRLDVSSARVVIAGNATAARLADANGTTLSGVVSRLAAFRQPVSIAAGGHRALEVDLDLDLSCAVDPAANVVRFDPTTTAAQAPSTPTPLRLSGTLASIDSSTRDLELQPPTAGAAALPLPLRATSSTPVLLDGAASTFGALSQRPLGTALRVHAAPESAQRYGATVIEAWSAPDVASGVVVGRTAAGTLTLRGATVERAGGSRLVGQQLTVLAAGTRVTREGSTTALALDEVAVGAQVIARGTLSGSTLDATGATGHLVLQDTTLAGTATGAPSGGRVTLDLDRVGGRAIGDLAFSVDGTPTANPAAFLVDLGGQSIAGVTTGSPVVARVRLAPFDATPTSPDATAQAVTDVVASASLLRIDWLASTSTPFTAQSSSQVTLGLNGTQHRLLDVGEPEPRALATTDAPRIEPQGSSTTCLIVEDGVVVPMSSFAAWQSEVAVRLGAAFRARAVTAVGAWDEATDTLRARAVVIVLE